MPLVAAFDPGRNVGYALVDDEGRLVERRVLTLEEVATVVWPDGAHVVTGSGTGSRALREVLAMRGVTAQVVDERGTSEHARALWRRAEPARGLARLVPNGLRSPDRPIDDYAAWAIALRYLGVEQDGR